MEVAIRHRLPSRPRLSITAAVLLAALQGCTTTPPCDTAAADYPVRYTMPDGRTVNVYQSANACGTEARGVWVRTEQAGATCALGYRCVRRSRGR